MKEITVDAVLDSVEEVTSWVNGMLEDAGYQEYDAMQVDIALDEIISNIARYAYDKPGGKIRIIFEEKRKKIRITFMDQGIPYDPLKQEAPDTDLDLEERQIGGLGIYLARNIMDEMGYSYKNGSNILYIEKEKKESGEK